MANYKASTIISNIFYNLFQININITIIEPKNNNNKKDSQCIIGENEKCKECDDKIGGNCLYCNKGYYLPINEMNNTKCLSCNKIENYSTCFGDKNYIICSSCEKGFYLKNNNCIKSYKQRCIIGENEKCQNCREEEDYQHECKTCNKGYYLSELTNKTECLNCNKIKDCIECEDNNYNLICIKCQNGYDLLNNVCI